MGCTQPSSESGLKFETNKNQSAHCIDGGNRLIGEEEKKESSAAEVFRSRKISATNKEKHEEVAGVRLNENGCAEFEEEEIVVRSFASLAGIEDENENEDDIETSTEIRGELKGNSNEGLETKINRQTISNLATSEEGENNNNRLSPARELISSMDMIPDNEEKSNVHDYEQELSSCRDKIDRKKGENLEKKAGEFDKMKIETGSEQDVKAATKKTLAEQQNEIKNSSKCSEKSEGNLSDDYKEALASVANEQRCFKEQLSIISGSFLSSPITPLSSASSLVSSAELPASVCAGSGSNSNYDDEDEDEDEDESEQEQEEAEGEYSEEENNFCAEAASTSTLRRLKMNTFKDVMVCERNRESMEAARRLFDELARNGPTSSSSSNRRNSRNNSLESSTNCYANRDLFPLESESIVEQQLQQEPYDMKIEPRSGSSISNSNSFRQTLVCSVSPISQHSDEMRSNQCFEPHPAYPINGDEIKQCQTAFRENRRLIEEQQVRAKQRTIEEQQTSCNDSISANSSCYNSGSWIRFNKEFLEQSSQSKCSRCDRRVYPVDKMELDFTRTKLNIHRACFKCQICSTLLR